MKAIVAHRYGGPEVMALEELPEPKVGPDSVLIGVRGAGVNPVDLAIRAGRLDGGFDVHFPLVPGWDVAGVVEDVGTAVTEYRPGDAVYGYLRMDHIEHGTYAQRVAAPVRCIAPKPRSVGFLEAAGVPLAGLTARQVVEELAVGPGDTVLVHGASGGVGTFAIQLANLRGARVIGTASVVNHEYLRSLGAEPICYGFGLVEAVRTYAPEGVDAVIDLVGGEALELTPLLLRRPGRVVSIVDAARVKELGGVYVFVRPNVGQLRELAHLIDEGRLHVAIEQVFPYQDAAEAHMLVAEGHVRGKVVLEMRCDL